MRCVWITVVAGVDCLTIRVSFWGQRGLSPESTSRVSGEPQQTWPKHQLHGCGHYWILLRGDTPDLAACSLAILERFTTSPVQILAQNTIRLFPHRRNACLGQVSPQT